MKITIISVGKKPFGPEKELIDQYLKRLNKKFVLNWRFIAHSDLPNNSARSKETEAILEILDSKNCENVILLDERGASLSNSELAKILDYSQAQEVIFIIGGAYGVDQKMLEERLKSKLRVYKISDLVMPHRLVRVLLAEQVYRSQAILEGHPYHHG